MLEREKARVDERQRRGVLLAKEEALGKEMDATVSDVRSAWRMVEYAKAYSQQNATRKPSMNSFPAVRTCKVRVV